MPCTTASNVRGCDSAHWESKRPEQRSHAHETIYSIEALLPLLFPQNENGPWPGTEIPSNTQFQGSPRPSNPIQSQETFRADGSCAEVGKTLALRLQHAGSLCLSAQECPFSADSNENSQLTLRVFAATYSRRTCHPGWENHTLGHCRFDKRRPCKSHCTQPPRKRPVTAPPGMPTTFPRETWPTQNF